MPFKKPDSRASSKDSQSSTKARKIFIGRTQELDFFVEKILKPDVPAYNIISISGEGGIGKTELLHQFRDKARSPEFKEYCLTAWADERQTTPAAIMEKFAKDLPKEGDFEKALDKYKMLVLKQKSAREVALEAAMNKVPDIGGAVVSMVPFAGEILKLGVSTGLEPFADAALNRQVFKDAKRLEHPVGDLTSAFVQHINGLAEFKRGKLRRRVILFFDTFEQLGLEAASWLLEYVLTSDLSYNIVLVAGGRVPIDASTPDDPKAWLPFKEDETIYSRAIKSFTEDETREYLKERGITEPERVAAVWQSSHGLPLFLTLLTSSLRGEIDPTEDVVVNFLRWIPPEEDVKQQLTLDGAFFSRPFNRDDLEAFEFLPKDFAYLPENKSEQTKLYNWLIRQDFVVRIPQNGRYSYQNLVKELFSSYRYQLSQRRYFATRKALIDYYQRLLEIIQSERGNGVYDSAEWLELAQALAYQLFMLPDEASHVKAIGRVLAAFHKSKQKEAMLGTLRRLAQGQPDKQVTDDTRKVAEQLIQYIEADLESPELLAAANFLLEKVARVPSFSPEILSYIFRNRGMTLLILNDPQQAIKDFNRSIELRPDEGWIYGVRGFAYTLISDIRPAIEDFNHALKSDPDEGWIYMGRGLANLAIGETQQAIKDLERAVELDSNNAGIYAIRSFVYLATNEFEKAIEDSNHALEMAPNEARLYLFRGIVNLVAQNNQQAIEDMNRVCELFPNWMYGYIGRGLVYASLHEPQQAIEDFDRAISLAPLLAEPYTLRGNAFALLNRPEQAIEDLNRALELAPNSSRAYVRRGFVYSTQNKQEQAIEDFSHALELAPNLGEAYSGRGVAHSALNQFEQAIADCDHAVELDPKDAWAYVRRGLCLLRSE
jgi:tetratricopeptide (TPR) repeat protein